MSASRCLCAYLLIVAPHTPPKTHRELSHSVVVWFCVCALCSVNKIFTLLMGLRNLKVRVQLLIIDAFRVPCVFVCVSILCDARVWWMCVLWVITTRFLLLPFEEVAGRECFVYFEYCMHHSTTHYWTLTHLLAHTPSCRVVSCRHGTNCPISSWWECSKL